MVKMRIYVIGNPLLEKDSIAVRAAKRLRKEKELHEIEFIETDSLSEMEGIEKVPVAMDAAKGIKKVELLEGTGKIETQDVYSMHDMDLGFELKLLKKLGKIKGARIIAIPQDYGLEKAVEEVRKILRQAFFDLKKE